MKTNKISLFSIIKTLLPIALSLIVIACFWKMKNEFRFLKKEHREFKKVYSVIDSKIGKAMPLMGGMPIPPELRNIPLADNEGVILNVKKIPIRNVVAPYNASIIESDGKFLLFFRYDVFDHRCPRPFYTNIGCAELDKDLNQTSKEFIRIDTGSEFSEDARAVEVGKEIFLVFNDLDKVDTKRRVVHLASINPKDLTTNYVAPLDLKRKPVEKNWVPFAYGESGHDPMLHLEYYQVPPEIFKVSDPRHSKLEQIVKNDPEKLNPYYWPKNWGGVRGGSPAKKVGNEYLAFFHSMFRDDEDIVWYIMGAYTFEAKPPFRVTSISHYPILFNGVYESPPLNTAPPCVRSIYPSGFVLEKRDDGKELIHVSCGENDSAIKIITLDKEALFKSMKRI